MRLTKKAGNCYTINVSSEYEKYLNGNDALILANKLGQLEDIEDELGIDLITLFKALKEGFYYRGLNYGEPEIIYFTDVSNEDCGIECYVYNDFCKYGITWAGNAVAHIEDYGKTWALTKEELK